MKKTMRKFAALLLAGALAATAALPTFAAFNSAAPANSTTNAQITNLAETTQGMTAYQILSASMKSDGSGNIEYSLTEWAAAAINAENAKTTEPKTDVSGVYTNGAIDVDKVITTLGGQVGVATGEVDDPTNDTKTATNALLTVLANYPNKTNGIAATVSDQVATFADLALGSYVVIATDPTEIYNPMEISVGLSIDENGEYNGVVADNTVAKYSSFNTDKDLTDGDTVKENLSSVSVGDVVDYKLTIDSVPNYPSNATNKTLYMRDIMSKGLSLNADSITLKVAGTEVTPLTSVASIVTEGKAETGTTFAVVFDYDKLVAKLTDSDRSVEVDYSVTITDDAVIAGDGNPNTYDVVYTRNPSDGSTYTPGPGKPITPTQTPSWWSDTDNKTKTVYTYGLAVKKVDETGALNEALAGAEFGVYVTPACADADLITKMKVDASGYAYLAGIEAGTYYIKETKAPANYALNDTVVKVVVNHETSQVYSTYTTTSSTFTDGSRTDTEVFMTVDEYAAALEFYTTESIKENSEGTTATTISGGTGSYKRIKSNGTVYTAEEYDKFTKKPDADDVKLYTVTTVYTSKPQSSENSNYTFAAGYTVDAHAMATIQDNKVANLPSTGGMGTTIFYVIGGILVLAAAIILISKKKVQQ